MRILLMNRLTYIVAILLTLVSCVRENIPAPEGDNVPEGYIKIEFTANIQAPTLVNTRAVDPDGLDVNNLTLFCFNEAGLFISTQTAELVRHTSVEGISDSGNYTAIIPSHTHIIHFIANHSEGLYDETDFPGQSENMVIANMEGGSGMLVYWSRFEKDPSVSDNIGVQLANLRYTIGNTQYKGVKMIRNQAKITIDDWGHNSATNPKFVVTGFRTVNIPAFGTVAPHHSQRHFDIVRDWESLDEFITLPDNQTLMSDIVDINTKTEDFVFETSNSEDRLVSVVIKGHAPGKTEADDKYYRIVMQHEDGSNFMIRRNHHYNINITGMLNYGRDTFEESLVAPASNNAWISVDEWVNEITDGTQTLWLEQTSYVLASDDYAGKNLTIPYKYTRNGSGDQQAPVVTWIENNVAYDNFTNEYDTRSGEGTITLRLYPMYDGNEQQVGSLLLKYGKLQRKISIHIIRTQYFTPSWISSQVYGVANENVTVMFTIPETCPSALFPFTVLISANHLDVRSESGQELPVYVKGEEGYFGQDWEGINYKYAYVVAGPGKHRLHMRSILKHEEDETEDVHLEADFFETITKQVVFRGYNDSQHKRIFVNGLQVYPNYYADDEDMYYMLAPQKKAAPVVFNVELQERKADMSYSAFNHAANYGTEQWHRNGKDEFLIYSKFLSLYDDYFSDNENPYEAIKDDFWEIEAMPVDKENWSANGRVMAFRTYGYKESNGYRYGLQSDGNYNIYMLTNDPSGKDVIRISANNTSNKNAFTSDRNGNPYTGLYGGNEYRSAIFDLTRYRPFRFAAQVRVSDTDGSHPQYIPSSSELMSNAVNQDQEEAVDDVLLSYKPGQRVDILMDITSFKGSDGCSVHPFGERFGEEFDVYIDAPMLEIDYDRVPSSWLAANNNNLTADKLRKDHSTPGRFIYTVDKYRSAERAYGNSVAHNIDNAVNEQDEFGNIIISTPDQSGERKLLPFKKSAITSKGDITITSDKGKVIYWDKRFHVDTKHLMGNLKYVKNGQVKDIPHDAFVAFVRMRTGARIGVITLYQDGKFQLNLRDEYTFLWNDDPIDFYYKDSDGTVYTFNYTVDGVNKTVDLALLYDITQRNETITLTPSGK